MELKHYLAVLKRSWWVVAVVFVVAVVAAYAYSKATKPVFQATSKLAAGASLGGNGNASNYISLTTGGLLNQFASDLSTRLMAAKVSDALQLDLPPEKVQSEIKAVPNNQDLTISISVQDNDPNRAKAIANKLAELYVQEKQADATSTSAVQGNQNDTILVSIEDPAVTPQRPVRPNTRVNVAAAGILGLIVGVLIAFGLDWIDDTVRGPAEAESLLDSRLLASIPQFSANQRKRGYPLQAKAAAVRSS